MTPEEEKTIKAIEYLVTDGPVRHECENCGTAAECPISRLPIGWRYLALGEGLWESVEDIDNETKMICSFCVARVEKALEESKICGSK